MGMDLVVSIRYVNKRKRSGSAQTPYTITINLLNQFRLGVSGLTTSVPFEVVPIKTVNGQLETA